MANKHIYVPGQLLATVNDGVNDNAVDRSIESVGGKLLQRIVGLGMVNVLIQVEDSSVELAKAALEQDPNFKAVQFNGIVQLS